MFLWRTVENYLLIIIKNLNLSYPFLRFSSESCVSHVSIKKIFITFTECHRETHTDVWRQQLLNLIINYFRLVFT